MHVMCTTQVSRCRVQTISLILYDYAKSRSPYYNYNHYVPPLLSRDKVQPLQEHGKPQVKIAVLQLQLRTSISIKGQFAPAPGARNTTCPPASSYSLSINARDKQAHSKKGRACSAHLQRRTFANWLAPHGLPNTFMSIQMRLMYVCLHFYM